MSIGQKNRFFFFNLIILSELVIALKLEYQILITHILSKLVYNNYELIITDLLNVLQSCFNKLKLIFNMIMVCIKTTITMAFSKSTMHTALFFN